MSKFLVDVLKRQITKYPMMTAADLRNSVPELQVVSERTIQRTLQKMLKMPAEPYCCPEAPSDRENEEEETAVCQELPALHPGGLVEGFVL